MKKYFVFSDAHGFYTQLQDALKGKGFDINNPDHYVLSLGDEFDRGPEAREMLNFLTRLKKKNRLVLIRGNHTQLMWNLLQELNTCGKPQGSHHYSNGTVETVAQLVGNPDITRKLEYWETLSEDDKDEINEAMEPWMHLVEGNLNYFEKGDYIFVHGWIPFKSPTGGSYHNQIMNYYEGWRDLPELAKEWDWAIWAGFPTAYKNKCFEPDKTIVCGHWACSAYWGDIKQERKPFPQKNRRGWEKSFEPAITPEFIAIDACTAYSGIINVLIFEETPENGLILLDE